MKGPNHVMGGVVFTGIFCSFWNVNIFSQGTYLGMAMFASLLPDIDHSRSLIGKTFYPLARWLDRHYGHRTVTHSLVFFVISALLVKIVEVSFGLDHLFLIYVFAFGSHLIFDMLTRQGIPLFYPFYRNPCVIGSNPDLRLSGQGTGEVVVFSLFLVMLYFCFPLFQNGFWVSYNKNFNTLTHLHSTARQTENLLRVDYDFRNEYGRQSGSGLVLYHGDDQAIIKTESGLITVGSGDVIQRLQAEVTAQKREVQTLTFSGISLDSLRTYAGNTFMSGTITSEKPFLWNGETVSKAEFAWADGFTVDALARDSSELQVKRMEWEHAQSLYELEVQHYRTLQGMERELLAKLADELTTDYEREISTTKLRQVRRDLEGYQLDDSAVKKAKMAYEQAKDGLAVEQGFSGRMTVLETRDKLNFQ